MLIMIIKSLKTVFIRLTALALTNREDVTEEGLCQKPRVLSL